MRSRRRSQTREQVQGRGQAKGRQLLGRLNASLAHGFDEASKLVYVLFKPLEFVVGDLVERRVPRIDVSLTQQFEAASAEFVGPWPSGDELGSCLLSPSP